MYDLLVQLTKEDLKKPGLRFAILYGMRMKKLNDIVERMGTRFECIGCLRRDLRGNKNPENVRCCGGYSKESPIRLYKIFWKLQGLESAKNNLNFNKNRSCDFQSEKGCSLTLFKPMICIAWFCYEMRKKYPKYKKVFELFDELSSKFWGFSRD